MSRRLRRSLAQLGHHSYVSHLTPRISKSRKTTTSVPSPPCSIWLARPAEKRGPPQHRNPPASARPVNASPEGIPDREDRADQQTPVCCYRGHRQAHARSPPEQGIGEFRLSAPRRMTAGKMKIVGPNAFERSYTLEGSAGEHHPEAIRGILGKMLPAYSNLRCGERTSKRQLVAVGIGHMEVAFAQLLADRFFVFSSVHHFPRSLLSELPEQMLGE